MNVILTFTVVLSHKLQPVMNALTNRHSLIIERMSEKLSFNMPGDLRFQFF